MLYSTAKISDIITSLQTMQGVNQKAELKSVLVSKGISALDTDDMATLVSKVNGMSNIKSIQRGVISDSTVVTNVGYSISIATIDITKSIVLLSFNSGLDGTDDITTFRAKLTSATSITLYNQKATGSSGHQLSWQVIEFNNVKSLQTGEYSLPYQTASGTIAISAVNTTKSMLVFSSGGTAGNTSYNNKYVYVDLTNSTTITCQKHTNGQTVNIAWQVIEFN